MSCLVAGGGLKVPEALICCRLQTLTCQACSLRREVRAPVSSEGPAGGVAVFGLGPSLEDDLSGRPFSGLAGRRLDLLWSRLGIVRSRLYLSQVLKCRTPRRRPSREELRTCGALRLEPELAIVRPRLVVALGASVGRALTGYEVMAGDHRFHIVPAAGSEEGRVVVCLASVSAEKESGADWPDGSTELADWRWLMSTPEWRVAYWNWF